MPCRRRSCRNEKSKAAGHKGAKRQSGVSAWNSARTEHNQDTIRVLFDEVFWGKVVKPMLLSVFTGMPAFGPEFSQLGRDHREG